MTINLEKFVAGLHDYIGRALSPIKERIKALEDKQPERGAPGADGKSVAVEDVLPALKEHAEQLIAELPKPRDGADGAPGADGKSVDMDKVLEYLESKFSTWALEFEHRAQDVLTRCVDNMPKPKDGADGAPGADGKSVAVEDVLPALKAHAEQLIAELPKPRDGVDGSNGIDGKSITVDDVLPALKEHAEQLIASLPKPKDGVDGAPGADGKSVALEDVEQSLESRIATWALDFERRAQQLLMRCVENIPKPRDGVDGAPGRDGFGFDDLSLVHDGAGNVTLRFVQGEHEKEFNLRLPVFIDRGVFREDIKDYKAGHGVTCGGNFYIAQKDAPFGKPGLSEDWRLAVKRGRDGARK